MSIPASSALQELLPSAPQVFPGCPLGPCPGCAGTACWPCCSWARSSPPTSTSTSGRKCSASSGGASAPLAARAPAAPPPRLYTQPQPPGTLVQPRTTFREPCLGLSIPAAATLPLALSCRPSLPTRSTKSWRIRLSWDPKTGFWPARRRCDITGGRWPAGTGEDPAEGPQAPGSLA